MSLKSILDDWQIDSLERRDKVRFIQNFVNKTTGSSYPWREEMTFESRKLPKLYFVSLASQGDCLYIVGVNRAHLFPTEFGELSLKDNAPISYKKLDSSCVEYEMYKELAESSN